MTHLKWLLVLILLFLVGAAAWFSPTQKVDVWTPWGLLQNWPLGSVLFLFSCFGMIAAMLFSLLDRAQLVKQLKSAQKDLATLRQKNEGGDGRTSLSS